MSTCDLCQPGEPMVYNGIIEEHVCLTCHYAILQLYQATHCFVLEQLGVVENGDEATWFSESLGEGVPSGGRVHGGVTATSCTLS